MMKKILLVVCLFSVVTSFSQRNKLIKKPSLGINLSLRDFVTPLNVEKSSLSKLFSDNLMAKTSDMKLGFGISYMEGVSEHIDYSFNLNAASLDYPYRNAPAIGKDALLLEAAAKMLFKARTDDKFWVPYTSVGLGASLHNSENFGIYFPFGFGVQFKVANETFVFTDATYNLRLSSFTNNNLQYSLGIATALPSAKKIKKVETPTVAKPQPEKDTDGDGIPDSQDKCPTQKGLAKYDGCPIPDIDGDGINDEEDKCPTIRGVKKYDGCPVPDTDRDGVVDEEDKCPTVPGLARYYGCPIPDTDGDGITDEEDKCPNEKGTKANNGCPELKDFNFEAKNVEFKTGSDVLTTKAMAELDKAVNILAAHTTLNIDIEGHTDNVGNEAKNQNLSQKRAESVKKYLVSKGIKENRLTALGFGSTKPIANNKTAEGRTQNRRVEFKIKK